MNYYILIKHYWYDRHAQRSIFHYTHAQFDNARSMFHTKHAVMLKVKRFL